MDRKKPGREEDSTQSMDVSSSEGRRVTRRRARAEADEVTVSVVLDDLGKLNPDSTSSIPEDDKVAPIGDVERQLANLFGIEYTEEGGGAGRECMAHPEATDIITTSLLSAGILHEEEDAVSPSAKKSPGPKRLKEGRKAKGEGSQDKKTAKAKNEDQLLCGSCKKVWMSLESFLKHKQDGCSGKDERGAEEVKEKDSDLSDGEYKVEKIRSKRFNTRLGEWEYLLKWVGFSDAENTWEPLSNLDCPDILEEFELDWEQRSQPVPQPEPDPVDRKRKRTDHHAEFDADFSEDFVPGRSGAKKRRGGSATRGRGRGIARPGLKLDGTPRKKPGRKRKSELQKEEESNRSTEMEEDSEEERKELSDEVSGVRSSKVRARSLVQMWTGKKGLVAEEAIKEESKLKAVDDSEVMGEAGPSRVDDALAGEEDEENKLEEKDSNLEDILSSLPSDIMVEKHDEPSKKKVRMKSTGRGRGRGYFWGRGRGRPPTYGRTPNIRRIPDYLELVPVTMADGYTIEYRLMPKKQAEKIRKSHQKPTSEIKWPVAIRRPPEPAEQSPESQNEDSLMPQEMLDENEAVEIAIIDKGQLQLHRLEASETSPGAQGANTTVTMAQKAPIASVLGPEEGSSIDLPLNVSESKDKTVIQSLVAGTEGGGKFLLAQDGDDSGKQIIIISENADISSLVRKSPGMTNGEELDGVEAPDSNNTTATYILDSGKPGVASPTDNEGSNATGGQESQVVAGEDENEMVFLAQDESGNYIALSAEEFRAAQEGGQLVIQGSEEEEERATVEAEVPPADEDAKSQDRGIDLKTLANLVVQSEANSVAGPQPESVEAERPEKGDVEGETEAQGESETKQVLLMLPDGQMILTDLTDEQVSQLEGGNMVDFQLEEGEGDNATEAADPVAGRD
ncbi:unnamed protein product [Darwinula stevensoni]|uniref:Chromo domain-containing protein n=1 Tax=Darwinula stevensoni TaxID=69355 RepID=A0A7R9AA08_9CRUS|nr:unnamed protein product [Darwinula stevensoni]CAG0897688.1 unnamed protein product [Darwinula stevensoni]